MSSSQPPNLQYFDLESLKQRGITFTKVGEIQDETLFEYTGDFTALEIGTAIHQFLNQRTMLQLTEQNRLEQTAILYDDNSSDDDFWLAYQHLTLYTESPVDPWSTRDENGDGELFSWQERYEHGTIGFLTELGELLDICKKHRFYGKPWTVFGKGGIVEELGDALWYASIRNNAGYMVESHLAPELFRFPVVAEDRNNNLPPIQEPRVEILEAFAVGATKSQDPYWTLASLDRIRTAFEQVVRWTDGGPLPSWRQIAQINIKKLHETRYPNAVFSQKSAVERDLAAEEDSLSGE